MSACVEPHPLLIPSSSATKSVVLIQKREALGITLLYSASPPFEALLSLDPADPALAFEFDRDLDALGLAPGTLTMVAATRRRTLVPAPLARYELRAEGLTPLATSTAGLELPEIDREAVLASGRCLEILGYISSTCGSTTTLEAFQVEPPAPPDLTSDACPEGWALGQTTIDRGPLLRPLVQSYCQPPARRPCGLHQLQAAGDRDCREVGATCPADGFAALTSTRVSYVRAGATAGDGSRRAPFATIAQGLAALAGQAGVVALAPGRYPEDVVLRGVVDLIGACASGTELAGRLSLEGHRGLVSNLRIRGGAPEVLAVSGGSQSRLTAVELSSAVGVRSCAVTDGARLHLEGALLDGDDGGRCMVNGGTLELDGSDLRGQLSGTNATITMVGSAFTSTGSDLHAYAQSSAVNIERSVVRVPVSALGESRLVVRRSWFELDVPSARFDRDSLVAEGPELIVERSVFATPTLLVPEPSAAEPMIGQVSIFARAAGGHIKDLLILLPRTASRALLNAVIVQPLAQTEPVLLERITTVGGGRLPQVAISADVVASDLSGYDCGAEALFVLGGDVELTRFEAARTRDALQLRADRPITATLRDLRLSESTNAGLLLRASFSPMSADISRVLVLSGQRDTLGISIRADSDQRLEARLRDVRIDAEISTGLELGVDAEVDLERFSINRSGTGLSVRHRQRDSYVPRGLHLRRGAIEAGVLGVQLPDVPVDLDLLLDQVTVRAPTLLKDG